MKILNFGSCNIDYVYSLDHIVEIGETQKSFSVETYPGGKGLNQSIAAAKAGAKVYHAGCIGQDSGMLTDILAENNVDISNIMKTEEKNGHAIIQVSKTGENSIFLYSGSNEMITKEHIDSVFERFSAEDIVLLQNEINNVDYIVEKAFEKNIPIILNPSPINDNINKIDFNKISYIILNEIEIKAICNCDEVGQSLKQLKHTYPRLKIILTLGSKGCVYTDSNTEIYQPAFKIAAVDTTAAGDAFTGFFVAELSKGTDYPAILKLASAASAITVSRKGAAPSIPNINEVLSSVNNLKENISDVKLEYIRKKINVYIEENIADITLEQLAENFDYSAVHMGKLVQRLTGLPFSKLIQSKRCRIAANQLINTDLSVEEIIRNVGYENKSFFRKVFKEKYGQTPLSYRKNGGVPNNK